MRRLLLSLALMVAASSSLLACDLGMSCSTNYVFGVVVTVRDANSQVPLTTAIVTLVDGAWREALTAQPLETVYRGAGEREGTYTITVSAPGYRTSAPRTVTVTGDECHVQPVSITVDLAPATP